MTSFPQRLHVRATAIVHQATFGATFALLTAISVAPLSAQRGASVETHTVWIQVLDDAGQPIAHALVGSDVDFDWTDGHGIARLDVPTRHTALLTVSYGCAIGVGVAISGHALSGPLPQTVTTIHVPSCPEARGRRGRSWWR